MGEKGESASERANRLAVAAKTDGAAIEPLWLSVCKLVRVWALRYRREYSSKYELGDLIQSAYFALLRAVEAYRPESGFNFATFLFHHARNEFRAVLGIRSAKRDPIAQSASIDAPLLADGGDDGFRLLDAIEDEGAGEALERALDGVAGAQLRGLLDELIGELPPGQAEVLALRYWQMKTVAETADAAGIEAKEARRLEGLALASLRRGKAAARLKEFDYYGHGLRGTGLATFRQTWTSATEEAALKKLRVEAEYRRIMAGAGLWPPENGASE